MAGANSQMSLVGLDFNTIKNNLKTFLQSQDKFKDYNFEGSGLSTLLDVLSYNTQYNAFYLNMVANEMFLDSSIQRSSVVSHAKTLNYIPKSYTAPGAYVNITTTNTTDSSVTLPSYTNFLSESVEGVNYNFLTTTSTTVDVVDGVATFSNILLKQGLSTTYKFVVNGTTNPTYTFELPDNTIDTSTILVTVQQSSTSTNYDIYTMSDSYLNIDSTSKVYFLQESLNGNYEIIFGDGLLGKKLTDGNIVNVSYIMTQGSLSTGANNFTLMDSVNGFNVTNVIPVIAAYNGSEKETIDSIKYQAPKSYSAQNRAVTKDDYITIIKQNKIGLTFDAVNVWGGQENDPPVYGKTFICMKPTSGYLITDAQKEMLIQDVIKPLSVMTVEPSIVDPDYNFIKVIVNVTYDPSKTTLNSSQIKNLVKQTIINFGNSTLNTFNSTFIPSDLTASITSSSPSIVASEVSIQLQKKFYPSITETKSYKLHYGVPIQKGMFQSGINGSPTLQFVDPNDTTKIITGVLIEEIPSSTGGIESISITNPGFSYLVAPTVTIIGNGSGATAEAVINNDGSLSAINVLTPGSGYTDALVKITAQSYDTTGQSGAAIANLEGKYGTLRTYYYNTLNAKTILNGNAGTIDYVNGILTLDSFNPIEVDDPFGKLTISASPTTSIISSSYNRIITIDQYDSQSIVVNVSTKK